MNDKQLCPYMTVDREDGQVVFACTLSIKVCVDADRYEECSLYRREKEKLSLTDNDFTYENATTRIERR